MHLSNGFEGDTDWIGLGCIPVSSPKTVLHRIQFLLSNRIGRLIIALEKDLRTHIDVAGVVKILWAIRLPPRVALANIPGVREREENQRMGNSAGWKDSVWNPLCFTTDLQFYFATIYNMCHMSKKLTVIPLIRWQFPNVSPSHLLQACVFKTKRVPYNNNNNKPTIW